MYSNSFEWVTSTSNEFINGTIIWSISVLLDTMASIPPWGSLASGGTQAAKQKNRCSHFTVVKIAIVYTSVL